MRSWKIRQNYNFSPTKFIIVVHNLYILVHMWTVKKTIFQKIFSDQSKRDSGTRLFSTTVFNCSTPYGLLIHCLTYFRTLVLNSLKYSILKVVTQCDLIPRAIRLCRSIYDGCQSGSIRWAVIGRMASPNSSFKACRVKRSAFCGKRATKVNSFQNIPGM
jgi:hypothetical protein